MCFLLLVVWNNKENWGSEKKCFNTFFKNQFKRNCAKAWQAVAILNTEFFFKFFFKLFTSPFNKLAASFFFLKLKYGPVFQRPVALHFPQIHKFFVKDHLALEITAFQPLLTFLFSHLVIGCVEEKGKLLQSFFFKQEEIIYFWYFAIP